MDIQEASKKGNVLSIYAKSIGTRFAAHLFRTGDGIAWADHGWYSDGYTGHPFHEMKGEVVEIAGGWLLVNDDDDYSIDIMPDAPAPDGPRELAKTQIQNDLGITIPS